MNTVKLLNGVNSVGKPQAGNTVKLSAVRIRTVTYFLSTTMQTRKNKAVGT